MDNIFVGGQPRPGSMPQISAQAGDARQVGGQSMPASQPYGTRQSTTQLIYQADGAPYRTSGRFSVKSDDRTYVDIHNLNPYEQVLYTYEGSHGYRDNSYLIYFPREEWYQERQKYSLRSVVAFKNIVDAMVLPVFEKEILRSNTSDLFAAFVDNSDNTGTTLQDVNETAQTHARMLGITFIVMDNFADASSVKTVKEAVDARKIPYVYEKLPNEVYKWHCNTWGNLEWITFFDRQEKIEDPNHPGQFIIRQYYRRWDKKGWAIYYEERNKNRWDEIREITTESAEHGLNFLPVYPVLDYAKSNNLANFPTPVMADIANMAFVLYNIESWILLLSVYTFPILTLPVMDGSQLAISVTNAIEVPENAKHPPQFISPPTDCLDVLLRSADRMEEKIYKAANQLGVSGSPTRGSGVQAISGISKEWDFRASNALLTKTAFSARKLEEWCAKTFAAYTHTDFTYEVNFPSEFVEAYSQQRIARAIDLLKEMPPESFAKEIWKEMVNTFFDDDPEKAKQIMDQVDTEYSQKIMDKMAIQDAVDAAKGNPEEKEVEEKDDFEGVINGILDKFAKAA